MASVEVAQGGTIKIPTDIRKKYRIQRGVKVTVTDEGGVITIRPQVEDTVRLAKKLLKTGG